MRRPFTLYKVASKSGTVWHARFWDETAQKYALGRSTGIRAEGKKEHRRSFTNLVAKTHERLASSDFLCPSGLPEGDPCVAFL